MIRWNPRRRDALVVALCAVVVLGLSLTIDPRRAPAFDEAILQWLGEHLRGPVGDALLQIYRLSGVHVTGFLVLAALIYVLLRRWWNDLRLLVMATAGILVIIDLALKPLHRVAKPADVVLADYVGRDLQGSVEVQSHDQLPCLLMACMAATSMVCRSSSRARWSCTSYSLNNHWAAE